MKPEDFRRIALQPGTHIGLIGDYNGPSEWSHGKIVEGSVENYLVVERHHNMEEVHNIIVWDAAAVVTLPAVLHSPGYSSITIATAETYVGNRLLLVQRHSDSAWDNQDPNVHVFGIKDKCLTTDKPLLRVEWEPKMVWLSAAAIMFVIDSDNLTDMAAALLRSYEKL
jgi:hypothetical protein